jgi:hypothetical protein
VELLGFGGERKGFQSKFFGTRWNANRGCQENGSVAEDTKPLLFLKISEGYTTSASPQNGDHKDVPFAFCAAANVRNIRLAYKTEHVTKMAVAD